MKVYDIALFLVILHLCTAVVSGMGLWQLPAEAVLDNMSTYDPSQMAAPGGFEIFGLSIDVFSAVSIVGFMVLSLGVSMFARVPTHQLVGIVVFAAFFLVLTGNTASTLSNFYVPTIFINLFVILNGIVLVVGIIQIATGISFEHTS